MIKVAELKKTFSLSREQLKAKKLRKGSITAVDGISFTVERGEIFSLLGPNGAGKTTTLRCMAGLISPDRGEINIGGTDMIKDPAAARNNLCFLTGELKPDENFTVDYLVTYFARLHGRTEEQIREKKKELFDDLGINEFADVKIGKLSTGMKQKATIALNLIHDPDIIIFDEPTNGLDVVSARAVTDYILKLKERGKTIVLSTHIMEVARRVSDRVAIILGGKIVCCGTQQELFDATDTDNLEDAFFTVFKTHAGGEA